MHEKCPLFPYSGEVESTDGQSLFYPYLELIPLPLMLFLHQVFAFISSFADGVCDRKNGQLDIDIVLSPHDQI